MISHGSPPYLECSSKGDARFSAFHARIRARGNLSIEETYQAAKIFSDGSTGLTWRQAKGMQAVNADEVRCLYGKLWDEYIAENPALLDALKSATGLSDIFGQEGHACQATELWRIREKEMVGPLVAVTGHRPQRLGWDDRSQKAVRATAHWALSDLRPSHVITGMALGWDQAIAEACIDLNIPFTAAVPFEGQERKWPAESQRTYNRLLRQAANVHHVCEPGYAAWKMQKRNQWMVDQLTTPDALLVALWDGTDGGTANCVRYAASRSVPMKNAWTAYLYFKESQQ